MHLLVALGRITGWRERDRARRPVDVNDRALMLYYAMLCDISLLYLNFQNPKRET